MDDKRNIFMAMVLTALILFGWPYVADRLFPGANKPVQQSAQQTAGQITGGAPTASSPTSPVQGMTPLRPLPQALSTSPRIAIETPKLKGSIALKGARIDDIVLPTYRETLK